MRRSGERKEREREKQVWNCIQDGLICRTRAGLRMQRDLITRPSFFPPRFSELENIPPPLLLNRVAMSKGSLKPFPMLETLWSPQVLVNRAFHSNRVNRMSRVFGSLRPVVDHFPRGEMFLGPRFFRFALNCFRITFAYYMTCEFSSFVEFYVAMLVFIKM